MLATCCLHAPTKQASPASLTHSASFRPCHGRTASACPTQPDREFIYAVHSASRSRSVDRSRVAFSFVCMSMISLRERGPTGVERFIWPHLRFCMFSSAVISLVNGRTGRPQRSRVYFSRVPSTSIGPSGPSAQTAWLSAKPHLWFECSPKQ